MPETNGVIELSSGWKRTANQELSHTLWNSVLTQLQEFLNAPELVALRNTPNIDSSAALKAAISDATQWEIVSTTLPIYLVASSQSYLYLMVDATAGDKIVTLPTSLTTKFAIIVQKTDGTSNRVSITSSDDIGEAGTRSIAINHQGKAATLIFDPTADIWGVTYSGEREADTLFTTHDNTETTIASDDLVPFRDVSDNPDQGQTITFENMAREVLRHTNRVASPPDTSSWTDTQAGHFTWGYGTRFSPPHEFGCHLVPIRGVFGWTTSDTVPVWTTGSPIAIAANDTHIIGRWTGRLRTFRNDNREEVNVSPRDFVLNTWIRQYEVQ